MRDLIDTAEMYLRTIYELEEEGVPAIRARIAERLDQSGPTVSQTVARMERDGLVAVESDRHLELTETGRGRAVSVMRKHRLAERLLADVIGLEWEFVHAEACRWEHVMSDAVERKLIGLLEDSATSPYGNPIPGLDELSRSTDGRTALSPASSAPSPEPGLRRLDEFARQGGGPAQVRRIGEHVQVDTDLMAALRNAGVQPGRAVDVQPIAETGLPVEVSGERAGLTLAPALAHAVLVRSRPAR